MEFFLVIIIILIAYLWLKSKKDNKEVKDYSNIEQLATTETTKTAESEKKSKKETFTFRVVGVTKENENGEDIQTLLKKIANQYKRDGQLDSFNGMTNSEIVDYIGDIGEFENQSIYDCIKLVPEEDNPYDNNAIKVYLKDVEGSYHHIGYVDRKENQLLKKKLLEYEIEVITAEFIGGKYKYVDYDIMKDKDVVHTKELTRGLEVDIVWKSSQETK